MLKSKRSFKDFYQYYILVVTVIILTIFIQTVVQYSLNKQQRTASLINIAGKQRLLSQQVLANFYECRFLECNYSELKVGLDRLYRTNNALQNGNPKIGLAPLKNSEIQVMFTNLAPHLNYMYTNLKDTENLKKANISRMEREADSFLKVMDDIVNRFQKVAEEEVRTLMVIELELAFISIMVILFEIFFIIKPAIKKITLQNKKLKEISWHQTHAFSSHIKNIKGLQHIIKIEKKIEFKEELITCVMHELDSLEEVSSNMVNSLESRKS
jgi:nitrate/nitrite-specific signal transduction histidine kinase